MRRFNITMPHDFYKKVKIESAKKGMTISAYIRYAICELWEAKNGRNI